MVQKNCHCSQIVTLTGVAVTDRVCISRCFFKCTLYHWHAEGGLDLALRVNPHLFPHSDFSSPVSYFLFFAEWASERASELADPLLGYASAFAI